MVSASCEGTKGLLIRHMSRNGSGGASILLPGDSGSPALPFHFVLLLALLTVLLCIVKDGDVLFGQGWFDCVLLQFTVQVQDFTLKTPATNFEPAFG